MPLVVSITTRHSASCSKVFNRYDLTCPRCVELANGAPARKGWNCNRVSAERQQMASIKAHFAPGGPHSRGACGPVCTFGDW